MIPISREKANEIKNKISFLFITATEVETDNFLKYLKPLDNEEDCHVAYLNNQSYIIGKFGVYPVVHVQTSMGSISRDASLNTTKDAISFWEPKAIIMVGIAFGKSKKKQNIGDVLISDSVIPYEPVRIGSGQVVQRGNVVPSGAVLLNRFRNIRDWNFKLSTDSFASRIIGKVLSGEKLIDNAEFKESLFAQFPEAIGGEMEGAGLYSAASHDNINEWIIVKGICDWADGNKGKNKEQNQSIAAESAVNLCYSLFSVSHIFDDLILTDGQDIKKQSTSNISTNIHGNNSGIIHSGSGNILIEKGDIFNGQKDK